MKTRLRSSALSIGCLLLAVCAGAAAWTLANSARADSLAAIFSAGNQAFAHGDYAKAIQQYERLRAAAIRDPDVYLNLGLAHARAGALGRAVLAFEQALRLRPSDPDVKHALGLARAAIGKRNADKHGEAVVETRPPLAEALVRPYTQDALAWLLLVADAGLFLCLLARRRAGSDAQRTGLAVAATLFGLGAVCMSAGLFIKRGGLQEGEPAIVLRDGAELREAPDPRALVRAQAPEGGTASVIARDGGFLQIRTAAGPIGWIAHSDIGLVVD
jgi:tetratricopeptide (TPR) repeat protein